MSRTDDEIEHRLPLTRVRWTLRELTAPGYCPVATPREVADAAGLTEATAKDALRTLVAEDEAESRCILPQGRGAIYWERDPETA